MTYFIYLFVIQSLRNPVYILHLTAHFKSDIADGYSSAQDSSSIPGTGPLREPLVMVSAGRPLQCTAWEVTPEITIQALRAW